MAIYKSEKKERAALLDLNLPGVSGLDGMQQIRHQIPATPIVLLSASEDRSKVLRAIEQGAKGYIPKSSASDIIITALQLVLTGGVYLPMAILDTVNSPRTKTSNGNGKTLTPRQVDVLKLLAEGHSNKSIGNRLEMAENTVRVHVSAILRFLQVSNRTEAGIAAVRMGLLSEGENSIINNFCFDLTDNSSSCVIWPVIPAYAIS